MPRDELTQPAAGADERAARAEARDEVRHATARLLENLGPVVVEVRAPVGVVAVLVRVEVATRIGGVDPPRLVDGAVAAFHRIGEDDLGAVRLGAAARPLRVTLAGTHRRTGKPRAAPSIA